MRDNPAHPWGLPPLGPARVDALTEVASIGAGHAATALSLLTGQRIMIDVPMVTVGWLSELVPKITPADVRIVGITMDLQGSLNGQTLLALPVATATRLADLMLRRTHPNDVEGFDVLEESALREAGNILGGAYMTALSEFLTMRLMPSPPRLTIATASELLRECASTSGADQSVCCVETEFRFQEIGEAFRGFFLLVPDSESLGAIFRAVRVA
jgi:chemotaxis protein CheC